MILAELPATKIYAPAGFCIYCGDATDTAESPLYDEHIVALGLGGALVLPKASCAICSERTRSFERTVLNELLVMPRAYFSMREPRRARRSAQAGAATLRWKPVSPADHPHAFFLPRFARPGIFGSRQFTEKFVMQQPAAETCIGQRIFDPDRGAQFMQTFTPDLFCKMLAKIAHGAAVAELGLNAFEPWLPKLIGGDWPYLSHYIGATRWKLVTTGTLHQIWLRLQYGYLIATVRLFARYGFQGYDVVVGRAVQLPNNIHQRWTYTDTTQVKQ